MTVNVAEIIGIKYSFQKNRIRLMHVVTVFFSSIKINFKAQKKQQLSKFFSSPAINKNFVCIQNLVSIACSLKFISSNWSLFSFLLFVLFNFVIIIIYTPFTLFLYLLVTPYFLNYYFI